MKKTITNDAPWISLADMMTALMVIFMFIAISFILRTMNVSGVEDIDKTMRIIDSLKNEVAIKGSELTKIKEPIQNFVDLQDNIYNTLKKEFEQEIKDNKIELTPDGTIRFTPKNDTNLFDLNSDQLTQIFIDELDTFIPRYWKIINDKSYIDYISEIRIEGHADTIAPASNKDSYLYNLGLSSRRAASVLGYFRQNPTYTNASLKTKERLDFLLTAAGFSYSRALNDKKDYVYLDANKQVNNNFSRRVEFRILTSNKKLIKEILNASGNKDDDFILQKGEFFMIPYKAIKQKTLAAFEVMNAKKDFQLNADYLWIKNYKSLGDNEYYQIYFGPFHSKEESREALKKLDNTQVKQRVLLVSKTRNSYIFK